MVDHVTLLYGLFINVCYVCYAGKRSLERVIRAASPKKKNLQRARFSPSLEKVQIATYFILCEFRLRFTALLVLTFWQHLQVGCGQLLQLFLYAGVVSSPCELIGGIALVGHFVHVRPMFHQKRHQV